MAGRPWDEREDAKLAQLAEQGLSAARIAAEMPARSIHAVRTRAKKFGVRTHGNEYPIDPALADRLLELIECGASRQTAAHELGINATRAGHLAHRLGATFRGEGGRHRFRIGELGVRDGTWRALTTAAQRYNMTPQRLMTCLLNAIAADNLWGAIIDIKPVAPVIDIAREPMLDREPMFDLAPVLGGRIGGAPELSAMAR